jgi:hypothetical protein
MVILSKALTGFGIFPVESALATHLGIFHFILVIDDFENRATDLGSELTQNAVGFEGLDH